MPANEDALKLLRSIDASLKTLVHLAQRRQAKATGPETATDRELDSKYGDPLVSFNPRDWTGESFKKARMSQCPPEFLELYAESLDYFAQKAEETDERTEKGKPTAPYKRKDAARARGWAKRNRERTHTSAPSTPSSGPVNATPPDWESDDRGWGDGEGSFS